MKFISLYFFVLIASLTSTAQPTDERAVEGAIEKLRKAMIAADRSALEHLTADSLSYGHSTGRIEAKREFINNIVSGKSVFLMIDLTDQHISISGDVAVVRHTLTATTNDNGKPGNTKLKVLLVWQKEKGEWKLLARQAVKYTAQ